jgi:hypothetical protein
MLVYGGRCGAQPYYACNNRLGYICNVLVSTVKLLERAPQQIMSPSRAEVKNVWTLAATPTCTSVTWRLGEVNLAVTKIPTVVTTYTVSLS